VSTGFQFTIVKAGTDEAGTVASMVFTILDLDKGQDDEVESVTFGGFVDAHVTADTQIRRFNYPDGKSKFVATKVGSFADNPSDPLEM